MNDEYEPPPWGVEPAAAVSAEGSQDQQADEQPELSEPGYGPEEPEAAGPEAPLEGERDAAGPALSPSGVDGGPGPGPGPGEDVTPDDPFGAWPEPERPEAVDADEAGSVEHVSGELDVPDGYTVLEGTPTGHRRSVAVVVSRFNGSLTNRMLACAIEALEDAGVAHTSVTVVPVPGAFELPLAAMALAKTRRYACVVALGVIVRGETPHFDYIASEAASGLQLAAIETGVPVAFGVLTVETVEQAEARIDRAAVAVRTALEMADLFARLRASARAA
jgi:6,7-dimethyl-8-ribityllumazine synthase